MDSTPTPEAWNEAEGFLRRARRILAITHVNPDGDAIGSLLGFTLALRSIGRSVTPAVQDRAHDRFEYVPGFFEIKNTGEGDFDLIVSLDASDLQRLGNIFLPAVHAQVPMLVIDHHVTNTRFGAANLVDPTKASTAEIIAQLIRRMNIPLTAPVATALLTGLVTDTLAFRTTNTTPDTLACAQELMSAGANLVEVVRKALVLQPFERMKFQAAGVLETKIEDGVAYAKIPRKLRKETGFSEERGDGGLVGTLITADTAKLAAVFVELHDGRIEIGFRASPGYDVSRIALELGGGGHPAAAGCTIAGPMRDAVNRVLPRLKEEAQHR
jgi:phosphoesterase RecJ-like protein